MIEGKPGTGIAAAAARIGPSQTSMWSTGWPGIIQNNGSKGERYGALYHERPLLLADARGTSNVVDGAE